MSIRYTITTKQWKCPRCQTIAKKRRDDDMIWLVYLAFLPITLIVLLVKAIYYYSTRNEKPHTKAGNEVVVCKKCGAYLITSEDMFSTHTRIACSKQDMLSLIAPVLEIMRE